MPAHIVELEVGHADHAERIDALVVPLEDVGDVVRLVLSLLRFEEDVVAK